jgi:hypothetical protein
MSNRITSVKPNEGKSKYPTKKGMWDVTEYNSVATAKGRQKEARAKGRRKQSTPRP